MRRIRQRAQGEGGMTLVEVLTVACLLTIVLGSVLGVVASVQQGFEKEIDRVTSVDQARLASEQVQRELFSARAVTVTDNTSMDVYTRTNETTRTGTESNCVAWRVSNGNLQSRRWPYPVVGGTTYPWWTVATNVVNTATSTPALFAIDPNPAYASRMVNINILTNANPAAGRNVEIRTSVVGRNIQYGGVDPCASNQPP